MSALKPAEKLLLTFGMYCARSWSFDNLELFGDQQGSSADVATTDIGQYLSQRGDLSVRRLSARLLERQRRLASIGKYIHLNDKHRQ